jgi:hypothetical protein
MKRLISFAAVVLMIAAGTKTYAQDVPVLNRVHVSGGPKIGVNLSKVDGQSWDGGY